MKGITKEKLILPYQNTCIITNGRTFQVGKGMKKLQKQGREEERKKTTLHL